MFCGPPGTGKSMLASRLAGILPPMSEQEAGEAAAVASISHAGFDAARSLHARRPDLYSKVEWYTFETGYRDTAEPSSV